MNALATLAESEDIRTIVAGRLRPPMGKWKQSIPLGSKAEFDALPPGWAIAWREFWFVLAKKRWRSARRSGSATFRVL